MKIEIPDELIPEGAELIEAYITANKKKIVVIGEPDWQQDHDCDVMGCGTFSHVICWLDLPASIDWGRVNREEAPE